MFNKAFLKAKGAAHVKGNRRTLAGPGVLWILCPLLCLQVAAEPIVIGFGNPFTTDKQELIEALIESSIRNTPYSSGDLPGSLQRLRRQTADDVCEWTATPCGVGWGQWPVISARAMVLINQFLAADLDMGKDYFIPALIAGLPRDGHWWDYLNSNIASIIAKYL